MILADAINLIVAMDEFQVIFAKKPWLDCSDAIIATLNENCTVPDDLKREGYEYFLEQPLVLELSLAKIERLMTPGNFTDFVIYYASNDAYPEWLESLPLLSPTEN